MNGGSKGMYGVANADEYDDAYDDGIVKQRPQ